MFNNNFSNETSNNTSNDTSIHVVYNPEYYDEELRPIIKKARQNERYRLPLHANHYKGCGDIRRHLHLFAGIGVEKLYLFYTHVLYLLDIHGITNGTIEYHSCRKYIYEDMLTMVKDPLFRRKLQKLNKFTEDDFRTIENSMCGSGISIIKLGLEKFGFDRK